MLFINRFWRAGFLSVSVTSLLIVSVTIGAEPIPKPGWQANHYGPGFAERVRALHVWDDGNGEALYAGGQFLTAGAQATNKVAHFDGSGWSALVDDAGEAGLPTSLIEELNDVTVMRDFDNALYVATWGAFAIDGPDTNLFRWDGQNWSDPGGELNNSVWALTERDGRLIAGGNFSDAGGAGSGINRLAAYDGADWHAVDPDNPAPLSREARALTVFEGDLIVGGNFETAAGVTVNGIARFDGSDWTAMDQGFDGGVEALAVFDGQLYAGGNFENAGLIEVNRIARWNATTSQWEALGLLPDVGVSRDTTGEVSDLIVDDDRLIVVGDFTQAGSLDVSHAAAWDGADWVSLFTGDDPEMDRQVFGAAVFQDQLYIGGTFMDSDGVALNRIARSGSAHWETLPGLATGVWTFTTGSFASSSDIRDMAEFEGDLVVAGRFSHAGELEANHIARWDGEGWAAFVDSAGVAGFDEFESVDALAVVNGVLYAGGRFESAGDADIENIASWNGTDWQPLGANDAVNSRVRALAEYDGKLAVGGDFSTVAGTTANRVALWDGSSWSVLDDATNTGVNRRVHALGSFNGDLIVGGEFDMAGDVTANLIARWNPTDGWTTMDQGFSGSSDEAVRALVVHDEQLYAGGDFEDANATQVNSIARWDANESIWMPLFGPSEVGFPPADSGEPPVRGLVSFAGDLVAVGEFYNAGGSEAHHLARWDGSEWRGVQSNVGHFSVLDVAQSAFEYDGDLRVGGEFTVAGGLSESGVSSWALAHWIDPFAILDAPESVEFPPTVPDNESAAIAIALLNSGTASMTIQSIALEAAIDSLFRIEEDECSTSVLAVGEYCMFEVIFTPDELGPVVGNLEIDSDASHGAESIELSGTGAPNLIFTDRFEPLAP